MTARTSYRPGFCSAPLATLEQAAAAGRQHRCSIIPASLLACCCAKAVAVTLTAYTSCGLLKMQQELGASHPLAPRLHLPMPAPDPLVPPPQ